MRENISVRQWQAMYRLGAFSGKDTATQCDAGWYDWFCRDESLAARLKQIAPAVVGITDPFILDNFYVWFKNNCPVVGQLYDDVRFEPLSGERNGKYFLIIKDSPHEKAKWVLYTERYGFQEPEFQCGNVRDMIRYVNELGPELQHGKPDPLRHLPPKAKPPKRKEVER